MEGDNTYYVTKGDKVYGPYTKSENRRVRSVLNPGLHKRMEDHLRLTNQSESEYIADLIKKDLPKK